MQKTEGIQARFVAIPKTGTRTSRSHLERATGIRQPMGHAAAWRLEPNDFFLFAFIREPTQRLISYYENHKAQFTKQLTFMEWAECEFSPLELFNCEPISRWGVHGGNCQSGFIKDKNGVFHTDIIGCFENPMDTWRNVEAAIKMPLDVKWRIKQVYSVPQGIKETVKRLFPEDYELHEKVKKNGVVRTKPRR